MTPLSVKAFSRPATFGKYHIQIEGQFFGDSRDSISLALAEHLRAKVKKNFRVAWAVNSKEDKTLVTFADKDIALRALSAFREVDLETIPRWTMRVNGCLERASSVKSIEVAELVKEQQQPAELTYDPNDEGRPIRRPPPKPGVKLGVCVICLKEFELEKRKGRPWQKCPACR